MNEPDFSILFHQSSKDHGRKNHSLFVPFEENKEDTRIVYYKTYPRLPKVELANASLPSVSLQEVLKKRVSSRDFSQRSITTHHLSSVLQYGCGITGELNDDTHRRAYPSGGALFPIEIYPLVLRNIDDIRQGLYHYNVKDHLLDVLWERTFSPEYLSKLFGYPWVASSAVVLLLTAVFWRTQRKYGERGYRYVFLEGGHVGQNIYLLAQLLGLKCCAVTGMYDEEIEKLLDIDGATESVIYSIALGL